MARDMGGSRARRSDRYLTLSASSISFLPSGTSFANSAYELFLRDLEPGVVLGRRERHDLDLVVLEHLDHLVVEPLRPSLAKNSCAFLPACISTSCCFLFEPVEALLRHQHRLVHEPQRVVAGRGEALHLLVDAERDEAARAGVGGLGDAGLQRVVDLVARESRRSTRRPPATSPRTSARRSGTSGP